MRAASRRASSPVIGRGLAGTSRHRAVRAPGRDQAQSHSLKGAAPAVMAVLNGEVKLYLSTTNDALEAGIKTGKVRLLAVSTAAPSPLVPGARPIAERLPGFDVTAWFGLLAARGTPPAVVERLNTAVRAALERPDIRQRFEGYGCTASAGPPGELGTMIAQEVPKWRATIEAAGIRPQ